MDIQIGTKLHNKNKYKLYARVLPGGFSNSLLNPEYLGTNRHIFFSKEDLEEYIFKPYPKHNSKKEKLAYLLESLIGIRILIKNIMRNEKTFYN